MKVYVVTASETIAYDLSGEQMAPALSILDFLVSHNLRTPETPCGGRGTCRKCRLTIEIGMQKLEVLACRTRVSNGMKILLPKAEGHRIQTRGEGCYYPADLKSERHDLGDCSHEKNEQDCLACHDMKEDDNEYRFAADIGTTTVVCYLLRCRNNQVPYIIDVISQPNAQRVYGADVMARVRAASEGKLDHQTKLIREQIQDMCAKLRHRNNISARTCQIAIAANTIMLHLYAGTSPVSLGRAPFTPACWFGNEEDGIYIAPVASGFIGGDIIADMIAIQAGRKPQPYLLLDLGTNGEIVLGVNGRWYACSAAAGPAFEGANISMGMPAMDGAIFRVSIEGSGGRTYMRYHVLGEERGHKARGICGSGLVDLIAGLLKLGIVDRTGMLKDSADSYSLTDKVFITQQDIRQLQLAKAAMAAGIRILCQESGIVLSEIGEVLLAGGFGTALDPDSACTIGLIPKELKAVTRSIGNAAGDGAISLAVSERARHEAKKLAAECCYVELSVRDDFMEAFIEEMDFSDIYSR